MPALSRAEGPDLALDDPRVIDLSQGIAGPYCAKLLADCGHRLIFCSVAAATRGIFTVTGLDGIFEFADDKFVALASLQMVG